MRSENFDVNKLADNLQGSCQTLSDAVEAMFEGMTGDDLTEIDTDTLDELVFCCATCGWWYASDEQNDDGDCEDCAGDNEEE